MVQPYAQPECMALRYHSGLILRSNKMIDYRNLDELMDKLMGVMPESAKHMQRDIEANMRAILETGLRKMNLVSRDEFDIQTALLARLQERVKQLEQQLKNMEQQR